MKIYTETLPSGFSFDMICVEGGAFRMGGDDAEAVESEKPVHEVSISTFYLGQYLVTQALWKAVMGEKNNPSNFQGDRNPFRWSFEDKNLVKNPSNFKGDRRPVEMVSWLNIQEFIQNLNIQTGKSRSEFGIGAYRMPTEAEWEYAARGGQHSECYIYAGSDKLKEVGWYRENSNQSKSGRWSADGQRTGFL